MTTWKKSEITRWIMDQAKSRLTSIKIRMSVNQDGDLCILPTMESIRFTEYFQNPSLLEGEHHQFLGGQHKILLPPQKTPNNWVEYLKKKKKKKGNHRYRL